MKKRSWEQIKASKAIHRKHAERYKANDYPEHRTKRMMAYTSLITNVIARMGGR